MALVQTVPQTVAADARLAGHPQYTASKNTEIPSPIKTKVIQTPVHFLKATATLTLRHLGLQTLSRTKQTHKKKVSVLW